MSPRKNARTGGAAGDAEVLNNTRRNGAAMLDALREAGADVSKPRSIRCPFHEDHNPSAGIYKTKSGIWRFKCHGCGFGGDVFDVRARASGRDLADVLRDERGAGGERGRTSSRNGSTVQHLPGCTLARYAEAKCLPVDFLRRLGVTEINYQGVHAVRIPYPGPGGADGPVRFRTALEGADRFRWKSGAKITLYGLDRLADARKAGYVVLTEGESDCHTLWYHEEPAVGIPGASNWSDGRDAPHLEGIATIYVVREPDKGGDSLLARLADSRLRDRVRIIHLGDFKDPSGLHVDDPERFAERWARARARATSLADELAQEALRRHEELAGEAAHLIREPDILSRFAAELERAGVVGEERTAKLVYLAATSRLLDKPVSVAVKGTSSAGKSHTTQETLRFFPPEAFYALSAMSERALAYSEEPLKHRTLVIYEAAGMSGDFGTYLLRSLLSEGRIRYETVEKTPEGLRSRFIEREGPTNLVVTTTAVRLHPENETRLLSLPVTDTQAQTAAIMNRIAEGQAEAIDYAPWHALQTWLAGGESRVVVPFARDLARSIPPVAVRLRRDFGALLSLVRAHALLHQGTRERDAGGRIIATIADYAAVRGLVADLIAQGIDSTIPPVIRETVGAVEKLIGGTDAEASVAQAAKALNLDKSAASRRCRAALDAGYLVNREDRRGRPARLVIGEPMPDDLEILPRPEVLHGCTVDRGDSHPLPPTGRGEPGTGEHLAVDDGEPHHFSPAPCPSCGRSRWWRLVGREGPATCGTCHPPVGPEARGEAVVWIGSEAGDDKHGGRAA